jgi:ribonucleoside-diphosphate reductase alpha chain
MLAKNPDFTELFSEGEQLKGKQLLFEFSNYIRKLQYSEELTEEERDIFRQLQEEGGRFTHHTSIAPTGTIALALGNNVSNGIEPSYSHAYYRNLTTEGKATRQTQKVYSYELLAYKYFIDPNVDEEDLPDYFVEADTVDPKRHLDMQIAAQKWVDSSISKTINVPTEIPFEDFKDIYLYGIGHGVKGTTVFRFNPETLQGVLTKDKDLKSTLYKFILDDGSEIEVTGEELIEYEGETHSAAMLYDAIKEGAYGKY